MPSGDPSRFWESSKNSKRGVAEVEEQLGTGSTIHWNARIRARYHLMKGITGKFMPLSGLCNKASQLNI